MPDRFMTELEKVIVSFSQELGELTYFSASALFREHIEEFASGLVLMHSMQFVNGDYEEFRSLSRRLCELSREVIFSADAGDLTAKCVRDVSTLFTLCASRLEERIIELGLAPSDIVVTYLNNIRERSNEPWASLA